jgi:hypothetical protein
MLDEIGKRLAVSKMIQSLNLRKCDLQAASIRRLSSYFSHAHQLRDINLSNNVLGDPGVQLLVSGLITARNLTTLNLISAFPSVFQRLSSTLSSPFLTCVSWLMHVGIGMTDVGAGFLQKLLKSARSLRTLSVSSNQMMTINSSISEPSWTHRGGVLAHKC